MRSIVLSSLYALCLHHVMLCCLSVASESAPGDEVHEKAVNLATVVYQLEGEPDTAQFVPIHEGTTKMLSVNILQTKQVSTGDRGSILSGSF